jgi:hypothetical protein
MKKYKKYKNIQKYKDIIIQDKITMSKSLVKITVSVHNQLLQGIL